MSIASETIEELKKINARLDKIEAGLERQDKLMTLLETSADAIIPLLDKFGPMLEGILPMFGGIVNMGTGAGPGPDLSEFSPRLLTVDSND